MLKDLVKRYIRHMQSTDKVIEEKKLIEHKLQIMSNKRTDIRKEISQAVKTHSGTITFLIEVDGKETVCQIESTFYPDHPDFITFCELTPIEELALPNEITKRVHNILDNISSTISE